LLSVIFTTLLACAHVPQPSRIIAVGDIHGAYDEFVSILKTTGLVNGSLEWTGGDSMLIQLGDFTDRGIHVKRVMDLLIELEKQAAREGGQVIALMGNHETLNLIGSYDWHATPVPVYSRMLSYFGDSDSEKRLGSALKEYESWRQIYPECAAASADEYMRYRPLGFVEYRKAMSPEGKYGQWIRGLPVAVRVGEVLFTHAGISPELIQTEYDTPKKVNQRIRTEIKSFDRARSKLAEMGVILPFSTMKEIECAVNHALNEGSGDAIASKQQSRIAAIVGRLPRSEGWMHLSSNGPLWFRGYAEWTEEEGNPLVDQILKVWRVDRIVVAHTPQHSGRIAERFKSRVFLIDTGMVYASRPQANFRPSALQIQDGRYTPVYADGNNAPDSD